MPVSQDYIDAGTPLGATLRDGGATFRVWAPRAERVYLITEGLGVARAAGWAPDPADALVLRPDGSWTGYLAGATDGLPFAYWVVGVGDSGLKRDPRARELTDQPPFPECYSLLLDPTTYPWHDAEYVPPAFRDLVVYQFHTGVYYGVDARGVDQRATRGGRFLDLLFRIDHLRALGVNAVEPLPIQEFPTLFSMGYNGTDYFSPENDYHVTDAAELGRYLAEANRLLAAGDQPPIEAAQLQTGSDQLRCVVDLCHLNDIAVVFDLVYNHAGGGFDDESLFFLDRRPHTSNAESLYFTDQGWAGGLVFDYSNPGVCAYLADNAAFFLTEYHIDGIRYDEVSVMDDHGGWSVCQELSARVRQLKPQAIQIAEYWKDWRWLAVQRPPAGMGFDAAWSDRMRDAVRGALAQAAGGRDARVSMAAIAGALYAPPHFPAAWTAVHCIENHDITHSAHVGQGGGPRIPRLADALDARSWYARSRARLALGLLLAAPGIPLLFMGQEILEDKYWSDTPGQPDTLIWWDGLAQERAMADHLAFTRDLVWLRRSLPALRGEGVNAFHVHDENRVVAFHRWLEGTGDDVVVVASLNEGTLWGYDLGFPWPGGWREVFNSDYYDHLPNPRVAGNGGGIVAGGPPLHGFEQSARLTIPANGLLVFARA